RGALGLSFVDGRSGLTDANRIELVVELAGTHASILAIERVGAAGRRDYGADVLVADLDRAGREIDLALVAVRLGVFIRLVVVVIALLGERRARDAADRAQADPQCLSCLAPRPAEH